MVVSDLQIFIFGLFISGIVTLAFLSATGVRFLVKKLSSADTIEKK